MTMYYGPLTRREYFRVETTSSIYLLLTSVDLPLISGVEAGEITCGLWLAAFLRGAGWRTGRRRFAAASSLNSR